MNFIEELQYRGLLHDIMPGTEELIKSQEVSGYIGFDPTADSLHVGNLAQLITLIRFQKSGHTPYVLIGGATGMIGDPSGKSQERNLLSKDVLEHNVSQITKQIESIEGFKPIVVNNYDWFKDINFLDFIRDVGKHITVNYMTAKDSVKNRIDGDNGISFTEFTYQLIQAYDFLYLREKEGVMLQMGGSDQWGNIITGSDLINKKINKKVFGLTTHLIKKANGEKFGKSEQGNIWLDPTKTSPDSFYQFWYNTSDDDISSFIRTFTLLYVYEIEVLEKEHAINPSQRILQKKLAEEVTKLVHGEYVFNNLMLLRDFINNPQTTWSTFEKLSESNFLDIFSSTNIYKVKRNCYKNITDFLFNLEGDNSLFSSKGDITRLIKNQGISINKRKIDVDEDLSKFLNLHGKYLFLQKGKNISGLIELI